MSDTLFPVYTNGDGIVVVTEQTCKRRICRSFSDTASSLKLNIPSGSLRRGPIGFFVAFFRLPIVCYYVGESQALKNNTDVAMQ